MIIAKRIFTIFRLRFLKSLVKRFPGPLPNMSQACDMKGQTWFYKKKYRRQMVLLSYNVRPSKPAPDKEHTLQWRQNGRDGASNHRRLDCLLNCLFRRRSKKTSKLRVTGLCDGNPSVNGGGFSSQRAGAANFFSNWWRHHEIKPLLCIPRVCQWASMIFVIQCHHSMYIIINIM